jgi:hypothetical protein
MHSASQVGVPGFPGTPELKAILKRIPPAHPTAATTATTTSSAAAALPYGCRTPDYILATGICQVLLLGLVRIINKDRVSFDYIRNAWLQSCLRV